MNFFKNAIIYHISNPMSLMAQLATIEQQLLPFQFTPCGSQDTARTGWVPATAFSHTLAHQANGQYLLTVQRQEKILPGPVIKQELTARVTKLESEQGRKLKKTEKDSLKDEVLHSLLPRVFSETAEAFAKGFRYIINKGGARSGKTFSILQFFLFLCMYRSLKITVTYRDWETDRKSVV